MTPEGPTESGRDSQALAGVVAIHARVRMDVSITVRHVGGWGWTSHWALLTTWLVRLREIYRGAPLNSNLDLVGIFNSFIIDCAHMQDVFGLDSSVPVSEAESLQAMEGSEALTICRDYANTWKHYLRRKEDHQVATIWEDGNHSAIGHFLTIAYGPRDADPAEAHAKIDALELAERAYADWQAFMKHHGIEDPEGLTGPILARTKLPEHPEIPLSRINDPNRERSRYRNVP